MYYKDGWPLRDEISGGLKASPMSPSQQEGILSPSLRVQGLEFGA